jgi:signal transduction histidine kinase
VVRDSWRTDALDEVVRLLFELDAPAEEADRFHDRICEAICRLTPMDRAVLFLYDASRRLVLPVGSHGVEPEILAHAYGNLEEVPIAQDALARDQVVISDDLAAALPDRYAGLDSVVMLSCTPVTAAGRWLGVIFADRPGRDFDLSESERRTMHALGRTAALATAVHQATAHRERDRMLSERIELAREVHERVMQRLFGVSLALGSAHDAMSPSDRARCAREVEAALSDLREALTRSLDPDSQSSRTTLRAELERLGRQYKQLPLSVSWADGVEVPEGLEPLAVSVLGEALRNAEKHASPTVVDIAVDRTADIFALEVRNDGITDPGAGPGPGIGLRLASYESMQRGGMLEYGRERDQWRVRLVLPADGRRAAAGPPS